MKQSEIEIKNLQEEINEILEPCIKCGMCKSVCPVFKVLREEAYSPRGKSILLSEKIINKIIFECTLCKACEAKCPMHIKITEAIKKARQIITLKNKNTKTNKEMIKNIEKTGTPFPKNPKRSDKLYCC